MNGTRRDVSEYARQNGFGRVLRIHRPVPDSRLLSALLGITGIATVVAAVAVFGLVLAESPLWRPVVLGAASLVLVSGVAWSIATGRAN